MRNTFREAVDNLLPPASDISFERIAHPAKRRPALSKKAAAALLTAAIMALTGSAAALTLRALDIRRAWEQEKGNMTEWSLEEKADFADAVQAVDPIWDNAPYRTARPGEIDKQTAKRIALAALEEQFGWTEETLRTWRYQESLTYLDADFPEEGCFYEFTWINDTDTALDPGGDVYLVQIDPADGRVLTVQGMDDLVG